MTIRRTTGPVVGREDTGPGMPHGRAAAHVSDADRPMSDAGLRFVGDVRFPARRSDLYASAVEHGAPEEVLLSLRRLPDRVYAHPEQVVQAVGDLEGDLREKFDANMPPGRNREE